MQTASGFDVTTSGCNPPLLAAVSVPKKKRNMKELNKKEAIGDMLDAFKEVRFYLLMCLLA